MVASQPRVINIDLSKGYMGITLCVQKGVKGCVVEELDPNDLAYKAGLKVGGVVTAINGKPVKDAKKAVTIIDSCKGMLELSYLNSVADAPKKQRSFPTLRSMGSFGRKSMNAQKSILEDAKMAVEEAKEEVHETLKVMKTTQEQKDVAEKEATEAEVAAALASAEKKHAEERKEAAEKIAKAAKDRSDAKQVAKKAAEELKQAQDAAAESIQHAVQKRAAAKQAAYDAEAAAYAAQAAAAEADAQQQQASKLAWTIRLGELKLAAAKMLPLLVLLSATLIAGYLTFADRVPPKLPEPPKLRGAPFGGLLDKLGQLFVPATPNQA